MAGCRAERCSLLLLPYGEVWCIRLRLLVPSQLLEPDAECPSRESDPLRRRLLGERIGRRATIGKDEVGTCGRKCDTCFPQVPM